MQDNEKKPALRFKGFTDPWEQRKLGEICDFITKGATPTTYGFSWQPDGVPFFRNDSIKDNVFVFGEFSYISEAANEVLKRSEVHGNDILIAITGDIGKVGIIPDTVEKANINQHIARVRIRKEALPYFVYQYLASDDTQKEYQKIKTGLSMPQLSLEQVRDIVVKIPEFNEQGKIADCLRRIDTLITLHQRKYEKLVNIKKSMLDKMFPQNGASVPEIRFKGFTDPWEQRKFGEVVDKYEDPVETPHDGYYRLGIRSHAKGTFHSYVEKGHELETAQMYRVAAGNFIVNITFGWEHAVAITNESDAGKLVSHRFPQYSFHDDMLPEFFKYVIADEDFRHWLWLASPGGAGRNRVLKLDEMLNYEMVLPSKEEQQRIAAIFRNLDTLITLHQRKLEKLQNIKKSCLEKMLV